MIFTSPETKPISAWKATIAKQSGRTGNYTQRILKGTKP